MPEKPPKKRIEEKDPAKEEQDPSWENDQKEKSYYYDDATGYEIYDPDEDDEDETAEARTK